MEEPLPDAEQLKAFRALRRPAVEGDNPALDIGVGDLPGHLDPRLGRRVYSGGEGRIYIVPGPGSICCIATGIPFGTVRGETTTALASDTTHGFVVRGPNEPVTFLGVVPATVKQLEIRERIGRTITVDLSADDGYWLEVAEPVAHIVSRRDGTTAEIPFLPSRAVRRLQG
jgi:hypothetical protein